MKRLLFLTAACVTMLLCNVKAYAWAETAEVVPYNAVADVTGKCVNETDTPPVYCVNIEWESMQFVYLEGASKVWNPETHEYMESEQTGWYKDSSFIYLTNRSNSEVIAQLEFTPYSLNEEITGKFNQRLIVMQNADGKTEENIRREQITFTIGGKPRDEMKGNISTIGYINVVIN